jgi:hypothetical protein
MSRISTCSLKSKMVYRYRNSSRRKGGHRLRLVFKDKNIIYLRQSPYVKFRMFVDIGIEVPKSQRLIMREGAREGELGFHVAKAFARSFLFVPAKKKFSVAYLSRPANFKGTPQGICAQTCRPRGLKARRKNYDAQRMITE